jgi:hypothetical protein
MHVGMRLLTTLCCLVMAGCATRAPTLASTAALDSSQGIVFGRLAVERDGERVVTDKYRNLLKPTVSFHLSPFEGVDKLNNNTWAPGKWHVESSLLEGGNFAIVLPAGRYYLVEFQYLDIYPGPSGQMLGVRSYVSDGGLWTTLTRSLFTFEVHPGQAIYLGNLLSQFRSDPRTLRASFGWDFEIEDELQQSSAWFAAKFPAFPAPVAGLVREQPL